MIARTAQISHRFFRGNLPKYGCGEARAFFRYQIIFFTSPNEGIFLWGGGHLRVYTTETVAEWLDLTPRRVRQLRDEKVISEVAKNLYDLKDTNRKYLNYLRKGDETSGLNYHQERAGLVKAKRLLEELELKEREKSLHQSEDIQRVLTQMLGSFRSRLLSIPAKLSPVLAKKTQKNEIYHLIKEAVDDALLELADFKTVFREETDETSDL